MEKRVLGKTGEHLSIVGFGGIVVSQTDQKDADNYVAEAIDSGVNYFDVAPSYGDAEEKLGHALTGKRNDIFLACKTDGRTKDEAERDLKSSLKTLRTDHFDLYQLHAMTTKEDVETVFGPEGAMETLVKARDQGLIRYIGFSAHTEAAALALMDRFEFDSVLFPINWVNIFNANFGPAVLKMAAEKGVGALAIKAMARTVWGENEVHKYPKAWYEPLDDEELALTAFRFTLSQPVTAAIPPGDIVHFRWALKAAKNFKPIGPEEVKVLKDEAAGLKPIFPQ